MLEAARSAPIRRSIEKYAQYEPSLSKTIIWRLIVNRSKAAMPKSGEKIFRERADVSCVRCHTAEGKGGWSVPCSMASASGRPRQYILESIVDPNAKIAPGFESAVVKTKSGQDAVGVVRREDAQYLVLIDGNGKEETIDKSDIVSRETGLSAMPQDIAKTLSKRDLRDLVEFLDGLKTPAKRSPRAEAGGGVEIGDRNQHSCSRGLARGLGEMEGNREQARRLMGVREIRECFPPHLVPRTWLVGESCQLAKPPPSARILSRSMCRCHIRSGKSEC